MSKLPFTLAKMSFIPLINHAEIAFSDFSCRFFKLIKLLSLDAPYRKQFFRERRWNLVNGDTCLKYDFPLNHDSTVIEIGGYTGDFSSEVFFRYNCCIHVYEPIPEFANHLKERTRFNPKITLIPKAVTCDGRELLFHVNGGATSSFIANKVSTTISCPSISILDVLAPFSLVDLLSINCEGGEYEILNQLLANPKHLLKISNFLIQFHDINQSSSTVMDRILCELSEYYSVNYNFNFVFVSLSRK
jgi:FkbM family methyltransferase